MLNCNCGLPAAHIGREGAGVHVCHYMGQYSPEPCKFGRCDRCGGQLWDNRENKRNPKAPDFKCRNTECKDDKGFTPGVWMRDLEKQGGSIGEIENQQRTAQAEHANHTAVNDAMAAAEADDEPLATQQEIDAYNTGCDYYTRLTGTIRQHVEYGVTAKALGKAHAQLERLITAAEALKEAEQDEAA